MSVDLPALAGFSKKLLQSAQPVQARTGKVLFRIGQRPASMFYVLRGEATMQRVTSSGVPVVLQRASGSFLAEASLNSERYHCDGVCTAPSELLAFPLAVLRAEIDGDPGTRWAWIALLGSQTRQQRARIERNALKTIRERLQHLIVSEGSSAGYVLPTTRMQLARELDVTPEALYRALKALQEEGALRVEGKRLSWRASSEG